MAKSSAIFACQRCGAQWPKWSGQCGECQAWNSLVEEKQRPKSSKASQTGRFAGYADSLGEVTELSQVVLSEQSRETTGLKELDRVLGGGLVAGSVVLLGGDPGVGKSTLLLQTMTFLSQAHNVLYVSGEESLQQITLRAKRLSLAADHLKLFTETEVQSIMAVAEREKPHCMVIDSIQTLYSNELSSAPGGVGQVRESASQLVQFAKRHNIAIFLIGHVTKEGALAGPRVLEHMVDVVLYFEGERDGRFRLIRAVKNRFGAANELGIFAMGDKGLREVSNPSAIFLSRTLPDAAGSIVMVTWEGTRPMLVEVQALVDESHGQNPRRLTVGLEQNRLSMLLAVLHRHGGIVTSDQDVFVNVVGGVRVTETAADLTMLSAIVSSLRNKSLAKELIVFGEVGLAGEIRPVQNGQERLREAAKHGFTKAIIPHANAPKQGCDGVEIYPVKTLSDALALL
jgi:DNA repair protein RadA/Sms